MATAEARELKRAHPESAIIIGDGHNEYVSPVFKNNPNIDRLDQTSPAQPKIWLHNYPGHRPYIDYSRSDMDRKQYFNDYHARPGDLFLDGALISAAREKIAALTPKKRKRVYIEPHVDFGPNKDWGFKNWQAVTTILNRSADVIQPVYGDTPRLDDAIKVDADSFLKGCAVLSECDIFIGPEGGMHHAAAALRRPGVVVFGGRIHPKTTGYDAHLNLYWNDRDEPCGMIEDCAHCQTCMAHISIEDVVAAARRVLEAAPGRS